MSRYYLSLAFLLVGSLFGSANAEADPPLMSPDVQQWVAQSSFVFDGAVKTLKASTVEIVPAAESTAVVRVDDVIYNAGVVSDVKGHDITVLLREPGGLKDGEHAIFFSNVNTYGESVVVDEVGHIASTKETLESIRSGMKTYQEGLPEARLKERIAQADLVLTGTITAVRPTEETEKRPPTSEHDARWYEATLKPESVEKGTAPKGAITFYFPSSDDLRWIGSPKFKVGQQGVFLLHRSEEARLRVHGLTALNALDFQTVEQRATVQKLIRATR